MLGALLQAIIIRRRAATKCAVALVILRLLWPLLRALRFGHATIQASSPTDTTVANKYTDKKLLNKATFGEIYLAKAHSGEIIAIKRVSVSVSSSETDPQKNAIKRQAEFELEVMRQLSAAGGHRHIISMNDHYYEDGCLTLVLTYCGGGDLLTKMENNLDERFSESSSAKYFKELLIGLKFLHRRGICHRDLSLENLLLTDAGTIVLCDFGLAAYHKVHYPTVAQPVGINSSFVVILVVVVVVVGTFACALTCLCSHWKMAA
jgi:serine/threonine protein kinase